MSIYPEHVMPDLEPGIQGNKLEQEALECPGKPGNGNLDVEARNPHMGYARNAGRMSCVIGS